MSKIEREMVAEARAARQKQEAADIGADIPSAPNDEQTQDADEVGAVLCKHCGCSEAQTISLQPHQSGGYICLGCDIATNLLGHPPRWRDEPAPDVTFVRAELCGHEDAWIGTADIVSATGRCTIRQRWDRQPARGDMVLLRGLEKAVVSHVYPTETPLCREDTDGQG